MNTFLDEWEIKFLVFQSILETTHIGRSNCKTVAQSFAPSVILNQSFNASVFDHIEAGTRSDSADSIKVVMK